MALSKEGLDQAAIVADLLGTEELAAVCSSPRERAWYTARDVAEPHGLKVRIDERLDEIDFGEWTGRPYEELEGDPEWTAWNEHRGTARCPGGETMDEAVERAAAAISDLAHDHPGGTVAAISHCDVIRGLIARYLGLPMDNLLRFDIDPASVSRVAVGGWGARVMSVNERLYQ